MTTILNVIFTVVSALFFAGRLFEIIAMTDTATRFITGSPVVTSRLMMGVVCVMAVCCGVIMFSGNNNGKRQKKMPVGIFGYVSGFFFIAGGIIASVNCFRYGGFIGYHIMEVLGGIGLVMLGINHLKGKKSEIVPMIFVVLMCVGVCLNAVVYEIKTIYDTEFMMRTLAGVTALAFFTMLFKNVIVPDKTSKMMLYITSQLNFVFAGTGSIAAIIGNMVNDTSSFAQQLYNAGFAVIGLYSLFIAFMITPEKSAVAEPEEQPVKSYRPKSSPVEKNNPAQEMNGNRFEKMPTGSIDKAAIEMLFARKEEREKQREEEYHFMHPREEIEHTQPVQEYTPPAKVKKAAPVPEYTEERTAVISRVEETGKVTFKGDGKKRSTGNKIVYKAPK
ncbi:MAG: hypothetical protein IKU54_03005 [Oscillospiraceae bacterium]|nr:hypothetical protein [Oscillospiraceae bacterium]